VHLRLERPSPPQAAARLRAGGRRPAPHKPQRASEPAESPGAASWEEGTITALPGDRTANPGGIDGPPSGVRLRGNRYTDFTSSCRIDQSRRWWTGRHRYPGSRKAVLGERYPVGGGGSRRPTTGFASLGEHNPVGGGGSRRPAAGFASLGEHNPVGGGRSRRPTTGFASLGEHNPVGGGGSRRPTTGFASLGEHNPVGGGGSRRPTTGFASLGEHNPVGGGGSRRPTTGFASLGEHNPVGGGGSRRPATGFASLSEQKAPVGRRRRRPGGWFCSLLEGGRASRPGGGASRPGGGASRPGGGASRPGGGAARRCSPSERACVRRGSGGCWFPHRVSAELPTTFCGGLQKEPSSQAVDDSGGAAIWASCPLHTAHSRGTGKLPPIAPRPSSLHRLCRHAHPHPAGKRQHQPPLKPILASPARTWSRWPAWC
jgi:hypothetical protein